MASITAVSQDRADLLLEPFEARGIFGGTGVLCPNGLRKGESAQQKQAPKEGDPNPNLFPQRSHSQLFRALLFFVLATAPRRAVAISTNNRSQVLMGPVPSPRRPWLPWRGKRRG